MNINNVRDFAVNYAYTYRKAAQHFKVVAKDVYGQVSELVIAMPADISNFIPKFMNFPASVTPLTNGEVTPQNMTRTS